MGKKKIDRKEKEPGKRAKRKLSYNTDERK